ncbi:MAG: energy transducer TonB [Gemmatimonadota bacterium]
MQQPTPLFEAPPFEFPLALWDRGVEGQTVLMVHITPLGMVDSAYVHESSGYAQFDSAAIAGAHLLRFMPGKRGERRVETWARLPVRFSRDAGQAAEFGIQLPAAPDSLNGTPDRGDTRREVDL